MFLYTCPGVCIELFLDSIDCYNDTLFARTLQKVHVWLTLRVTVLCAALHVILHQLWSSLLGNTMARHIHHRIDVAYLSRPLSVDKGHVVGTFSAAAKS